MIVVRKRWDDLIVTNNKSKEKNGCVIIVELINNCTITLSNLYMSEIYHWALNLRIYINHQIENL